MNTITRHFVAITVAIVTFNTLQAQSLSKVDSGLVEATTTLITKSYPISCGGCRITTNGKLQLPMETKNEVKTFVIDRTCSECVQGLMRPTGIVLTSNPPQYPHKCTNCTNTETYFKNYPYTIVQ